MLDAIQHKVFFFPPPFFSTTVLNPGLKPVVKKRESHKAVSITANPFPWVGTVGR